MLLIWCWRSILWLMGNRVCFLGIQLPESPSHVVLDITLLSESNYPEGQARFTHGQKSSWQQVNSKNCSPKK